MSASAKALHPPRSLGLLAVICALLVICPVGICRAASNAESKTATSAPAVPVRNSDWAVLVDKNINLYRVTPTFYRSAQFKKTELAELEKLGIRTSVDLRKFHSDTSELKGSSIKQVRLGTNTWSIGDQTVIAALVAIRLAEATGPVVLHCHHGADRTGLVTAMYRIVYQGWTKEAALNELLNGGYGYHPVWKNIPEYLRNVDIEKIKKAVDRELAKQGAVTSANPQASPKDSSPIE